MSALLRRFALGAMVLALATTGPSPANAAWMVEEAASNAPEVSMQLTRDGRPVIAFGRTSTVVGIRAAGGGWTYDTLAIQNAPPPIAPELESRDPELQIITFVQPSIDLDPLTEEPRLAWFQVWNDDVWYAERNGGTWGIVRLSHQGNRPSLVVDRQGTPHVSFVGSYATRGPGGWVFEPVGTYFSESSLLLDRDDRPTLALATGNEAPTLRLATRDGGGGWVLEGIDFSGHAVWQTSAALDGADQPHVAFVDDVSQLVRYARRDGAGWNLETVAGPVGAGSGVSLALGAGGEPFIAYWDRNLGHEMFARRVAGGWVSEPCDDADTAGGHSSAMRIDRDGRVHIVWVNHTANTVRYATNSAPVTAVEPLAIGPGFGIASVGPNPARAGGSLALALRLDAPREVALELFDLAGRRVAAREPATLAAGIQRLEWTPRVSSGGLYFLSVRSHRGERGTARVAITR